MADDYPPPRRSWNDDDNNDQRPPRRSHDSEDGFAGGEERRGRADRPPRGAGGDYDGADYGGYGVNPEGDGGYGGRGRRPLHRDEEYDGADGYGRQRPPQRPVDEYDGAPHVTVAAASGQVESLEEVKGDVRRHKREEVVAGLGALAAGGFALYEANEAKKHPEEGPRHQIEAGVAGAVAVASAGFGVYEHQRKEGSEDAQEALEPKKHHWFS